jgi:hypothetical protein
MKFARVEISKYFGAQHFDEDKRTSRSGLTKSNKYKSSKEILRALLV